MDMDKDLKIIVIKFFVVLFMSFVLFASITCKKESGRRERNRHSGHLTIQNDRLDSVAGQCELAITCKGDTTQSTPVKLPIKGPKGPPGRQGPKGEQGETGKPGIPGAPGEQGKSTNETYRIGFFVGLSENKGKIEENVDLVFDKVHTNVGEAYDTQTGRVTIPFSGLYHFTVVVAAQGGCCDVDEQRNDGGDGMGGEYTVMGDIVEHRHIESIIRGPGLARASKACTIYPWLHVFVIFWTFIV